MSGEKPHMGSVLCPSGQHLCLFWTQIHQNGNVSHFDATAKWPLWCPTGELHHRLWPITTSLLSCNKLLSAIDKDIHLPHHQTSNCHMTACAGNSQAGENHHVHTVNSHNSWSQWGVWMIFHGFRMLDASLHCCALRQHTDNRLLSFYPPQVMQFFPWAMTLLVRCPCCCKLFPCCPHCHTSHNSTWKFPYIGCSMHAQIWWHAPLKEFHGCRWAERLRNMAHALILSALTE